MTQLVAIIGSPRKRGNTYHAVARIVEHMQALGDVTVEYIHLTDANLAMCRGCFTCLARGEDLCPLQDARAEIEAKMLAADGVIFASPAYCQTVTGLMKNYIDRMAYVFHRPRFFRQSALLVCTSAGAGLKETLDYLSALRIWGFRTLDRVSLMTPPYPAKEAQRAKDKAVLAQAAQRFYRNLASGASDPPSLTQLIHFQAIRGNALFAPTYMPADLRYLEERGRLDGGFWVDVPVSPIKLFLARQLVKLIGRTFERNYTGG